MSGRCLLLIALLLAAAGCRESDRATPAAGSGSGRLQIAVIPKGTTHEFWKSVHAGARNAAKELGDVEILWKGPLKEEDTQGQIDVVETFVNRGVDGIVLAPNDSQGLVSAVEYANSQGVPVVIFDSGLDPGPDIVSYVATDNYKAGAAAGRRMAEVLDEKGDVILLRYKAGSESTMQREEGFLDALKEYPQINILTSSEYAGTSPQEALDKATQVLQKFRNEVDGIFAVCEPNAEGVLQALEQTQMAGKVKFIAFDPNANLIKALSEGKVEGIVLQDPVRMGYEGVRAMVRHLRGEEVESVIDTGEFIATPQNMDEPRMQMLLKPQQYDE